MSSRKIYWKDLFIFYLFKKYVFDKNYYKIMFYVKWKINYFNFYKTKFKNPTMCEIQCKN
jgi:hypothetical protein